MSGKKLHIIHLLPWMFPYGAYGLLSELHYAIDKYHSEDVTQEIICLEKDVIPPHFTLPLTFNNLASLPEHIKNKTRPAVLFYKLSATECKPISPAIMPFCPFWIVNVTACTNCSGLTKSSGIIAVSDDMYRKIRTRFGGFKIHYIKNGVNRCRYNDIAPLPLDTDKDYFATGRLNNFNKCKHPEDWVKWICQQTDIGRPMWHDYIGGGARHVEASKQLVKYRGNKFGNILTLPGRINDFEEKVSYIKRWNAFLYEIPGNEGISMSLLEGLACGVPALINDKPGNNEIIKNGTNGWVCKDRGEMISRLRNMVKNPNMLADLKQSTIASFDKKLDARKMAAAYVELLKGSVL